MQIVRPEAIHLESYLCCLKRELSLGNYSDDDARIKLQQIAQIKDDPFAFLAKQDDPLGLSGDVELPDGTLAPGFPNLTRWMWDDEVSGAINLRWQPGISSLPSSTFGRIGIEVFSWKRNMGYGTEALKQILPEAIKLGMPFLQLTTTPTNLAAQTINRKNGAVLHEEFVFPSGDKGLKFRIYL